MPRTIAAAAALVLGLLLAAPLAADTLLTKKRDADDFIGPNGTVSQSAKNQKVEIWIGPDRVRRDDGQTAVLLRLDQRKIYFINRPEKTYAVTDLRQKDGRWVAEIPSPLPKGLPEGVSLDMEEERKVWRFSARAEPTGETRKIGSWQATRYNIVLSNQAGTAQRTGLDWWVAPDLKVEDAPLRTLLRILAAAAPQGDEWLAAVLDLPGHPVLFERKDKQPDVDVKTREELVSVKESAPPAGIYELPAGYRLQDFREYMSLYGLPDPL
jgi:hypothetical protein